MFPKNKYIKYIEELNIKCIETQVWVVKKQKSLPNLINPPPPKKKNVHYYGTHYSTGARMRGAET